MTFDEAYRTHFDYVWRTLRRLGVREADASDAAQDVFIVVHRKLETFEGNALLTTWLFRICMYVASERRRSASARHEVADEALDPPSTAPNAEEDAQRKQELALAEGMMDSLTDEQRAVFVLFEIEEMNGDEIAEALEIPVGTVRSRLRMAREAFQAAMTRAKARSEFAGAARSAVKER